MTTISMSATAESYALTNAEPLMRELEAARSLAYPHHERDALIEALGRAYEQGETDGVDAYECSEPHLRVDVESLLLELSAGMQFESERVQKLVKWIRDDIARTL